MSATTQQPAIGTTNGTRRGRPNSGAKRIRRTKAQLAAANAPNPGGMAPAVAAAPAIVRGDPAMQFAASVIADLVAYPAAVRDRAAAIIGPVCAKLLKAA